MQKRYKDYVLQITLLFALLSLNACSSFQLKEYSGIKPGDVFVLHQNLTINAETARIFIQNGNARSGGGFDHFRQHCRLEVKTLAEQPRILPRGNYTISAINVDEEQIANKPQTVQLALSGGIGIFTDFNRLGGFVTIGTGDLMERVPTMDLVHFYLTSPQFPDILRLTCAGALSDGNPMDTPHSYRPDLQAINKILGPIGYIKTLAAAH